MSDFVDRSMKFAQKMTTRVGDMAQFAKVLTSIENYSPDTRLKLFGLTQVPLLFLVQPKIVKLDSEGSEIRINLNFLTKNHLSSMYFGAQAIGADIVVGMLALEMANEQKGFQIPPIFKNFTADFIKRAEGDVLFVCNAGPQVRRMVDVTINTGERVTESVAAEARLLESGEVVSRFTLGLSIKAKPL